MGKGQLNGIPNYHREQLMNFESSVNESFTELSNEINLKANKTEVPTLEDISNINTQLVASNNVPFRFGVNENGEYGYIITDSAGADTVIPFMSKGDLLWENPNPSVNFSAQAITLENLQDYDFVVVEWGYTVAYLDTIYYAIIPTNLSDYMGIYSDNVWKTRPVRTGHNGSSTSETSVWIGNCTASGTTYNNSVIPLRIYGKKKSPVIGIAGDVGTGLKTWINLNYDGSVLTIDDAKEITAIIAFMSSGTGLGDRVNCWYKDDYGNVHEWYDTTDLNITVVDNTFSFTNPWYGQTQRINIFAYYRKESPVNGEDADVINLTELLWTNPDSTVKFAAQTIPLDLSGYDAVAIKAIPHMNGNYNEYTTTVYCEVGAKCALGRYYASSGSVREVIVETTGVTISDVCGVTATNDTQNATAIPVEIYGIREALMEDINNAGLLWEDETIATSFAAQTVSLDLSEYDAVLIETRRYGANTSLLAHHYAEVGTTELLGTVINGGMGYRNVTVDENGLTFEAGYAGGAVNNYAQIPHKIYGLRKIAKAYMIPYASWVDKGSNTGLNTTYYENHGTKRITCTAYRGGGGSTQGVIRIYASNEKITTTVGMTAIVEQYVDTIETEYTFDIVDKNGSIYAYIAIGVGCTSGSSSGSSGTVMNNIVFE